MIEEIALNFITKSDNDFENFLKSQNLIKVVKEILSTYVSDKNSSFLREMVSCHIAGYKHSTEKLGYDGYKEKLPCEIKPQNVDRDSKRRLNLGGSFSDFTWKKFNKCSIDKLNMIMSGFVDGKLIYIITFPFNCEEFKNHLLKQLNKKLPNGDISNEYIRSCSWSFIHIKNENLSLEYLSSDYIKYRKNMTKKLFDFIQEKNSK